MGSSAMASSIQTGPVPPKSEVFEPECEPLNPISLAFREPSTQTVAPMAHPSATQPEVEDLEGTDRWPSRDAFEVPAIGSWTYRLMIRWGWLLMRTHFRIEIRGES